ncbi:hypothetical protein [Cylindrospermopsis raciborskii]|uniref:hypothetical protein n=1 Tax=Cylindrospermopsis raciborskii TaxID=77022 RepID=UPI0038D12C54
MSSSVKTQLDIIVNSSKVIGFSGSRQPKAQEIKALLYIIQKVPKNAQICVGCAHGIDNLVINHFPHATVFKASDYQLHIKAALASRSTACVKAVPSSPHGLVIGIPSGSCPPEVKPSRSFSGYGSGSWGTIAISIGLEKRVCLFSPHPPKWVGQEIEENWWYYEPPLQPTQISLF